MATTVSDSGNIYLYAVIKGVGKAKFDVKGLFDSDVFTITEKDISAVVSEIPTTDKLRPERKHLAAHQRVLTHLVEHEDVVLPVSFGTVADRAKGIRDMLSKYYKSFNEQIERISGRLEMELRVTYEVPNVFEYFVEKYPDLKRERDQVYKGNGEPNRDQKIQIGQLFEQVQSQDREQLTSRVEEKLRQSCAEIKRNRPRNEKEVMRISCLLDKDAMDGFQSALNDASEQFDDNFVFEYNGPIPPYNFVDVRVQM